MKQRKIKGEGDELSGVENNRRAIIPQGEKGFQGLENWGRWYLGDALASTDAFGLALSLPYDG
ncbi:hypothetical protein Ct61P_09799 [Colletotrichum tofieldiae]|nr:hypothetical protein Ct61P_09799 [Colletotrichum tofieldiae]